MRAFLLSVVCLSGLGLAVYAQQEPAQPAAAVSNVPDSIEVKVVGTLSTGVVAIGGETTGVTITSGNITWEVDFSQAPEMGKMAQELVNSKVMLEGNLERRAGVEISSKDIVIARNLVPLTMPMPAKQGEVVPPEIRKPASPILPGLQKSVELGQPE
ncbi:MAG: hypothetical protein R3C11_13135 [Planctomycetaceae bacterium]